MLALMPFSANLPIGMLSGQSWIIARTNNPPATILAWSDWIARQIETEKQSPPRDAVDGSKHDVSGNERQTGNFAQRGLLDGAHVAVLGLIVGRRGSVTFGGGFLLRLHPIDH
jgi:hypothetical protein